MVHEQGGRRRNLPGNIAELLLLGEAPRHRRRDAGRLPVPLPEQHPVAERGARVAAPDGHGRGRATHRGAAGRLTSAARRSIQYKPIQTLRNEKHAELFYLWQNWEL